MMKIFLSLMTCLASINLWAGAPQAPQYLYSMDLERFNPGVGQAVAKAENLDRIVESAAQINNIELLEADPREIRLHFSSQGNVQSGTVYLKFKNEDSARILKQMLESDTSYHLLYDYYAWGVELHSWLNINASALYVWNQQSNSIVKIGDLIGPQRKVEDQRWVNQILIQVFGRDVLNKWP